MKKNLNMTQLKKIAKGRVFLSPKETSEFLSKIGIKIGVRKLYRMVQKGSGIKSVKISGNRVFYIDDILTYVVSQYSSSTPMDEEYTER